MIPGESERADRASISRADRRCCFRKAVRETPTRMHSMRSPKFAALGVPTTVIISFTSLSFLVGSYRFRCTRDGHLSQDFIHHLCGYLSGPLSQHEVIGPCSLPSPLRIRTYTPTSWITLDSNRDLCLCLDVSFFSALSIASFGLNKNRNGIVRLERPRHCMKPMWPPAHGI